MQMKFTLKGQVKGHCFMPDALVWITEIEDTNSFLHGPGCFRIVLIDHVYQYDTLTWGSQLVC